MASMLPSAGGQIRLLDPGAGVGSLVAAAVADLVARDFRPREISVTACEIDPALCDYLDTTLYLCRLECQNAGVDFSAKLVRGDFIEAALEPLKSSLFQQEDLGRFDSAILNPPYRKIAAGSKERNWVGELGVQVSNLYTGFLATTVHLLKPQGSLVAITPRSFCNGPYFRSFRRFFLDHMTLTRLHLFESREAAFSEDSVLQENVILVAAKGEPRAGVKITSSVGPDDDLLLSREAAYGEVVRPNGGQYFIHIVADEIGTGVVQQMESFHASLSDLGVSVSTGPVVDFRAREYLRQRAAEETVPLIHPVHFVGGTVLWPRDGRKPNAIVLNDYTRRLLVPNAPYVLVRRFSSKEERRRIVAVVHDPANVPGDLVGIENHVNYFHSQGNGLTLQLARGLAAYLNSSLVDAHFRQFSGHTQVNATDLRALKYPARESLEALGARLTGGSPTQAQLDQLVESELLPMAGRRIKNPIVTQRRIKEALEILKALGMPREQVNERSALTLLGLLDIRPTTPWRKAQAPLRGITPLMEFFARHYGKTYAPNTRETVRRFTVHQFVDAGFVVANPDEPSRPTNSPKTVYRVESDALILLRSFGGARWQLKLAAYLRKAGRLRDRYARERRVAQIPVVYEGAKLHLSPGSHNALVKQVLEVFAARYARGATPLYVGDTAQKFAHFDESRLASLGVSVDQHGKMPDVVLYDSEREWLFLIEVVTSHGPVNPKRRAELVRLFRGARAGLVFVTAFANRGTMVRYLREISWETEVWVADSPTHLIHFNGERFLGPYER